MTNKTRKPPIGTKDRALSDLSGLIDSKTTAKEQRSISEWVSRYTQMLRQERTFSPKYLKRYRRGEIVLVDFGYRIGNEERGPHYAVILDKANELSSGIVTVLPLSSKKKSTRFGKYVIDLGDEIYQKMKIKAGRKLLDSISDVKATPENPMSGQEIEVEVSVKDSSYQKLFHQIDSMKEGSIALLSQITTISKIRIIQPKKGSDPLAGIRLSDETLDIIDKRIIQLYTGVKLSED